MASQARTSTRVRRAPGAGPDRSRRGLDRQAIVRAALELLDERGLESLTMRRLARALGVAPMTVYWHVGDRDELLDAIAELVLADFTLPVAVAGAWRDRMTAILLALRNELLAHPQVVPLLARQRRLAPAIVTAGAGILTLAAELGLDDRETVEVFRAVVWHTLGSLFVEAFLADRGLFGEPAATRAILDRAVRSSDVDDTTIRRLESELTRFDADELFLASTARLLDGIELHARHP